MPPSRVIDRFIEIGWDRQNASEHVAGRCSDSTFVRRVYLDLAGRIPTRKERNAFLQSKEPRKRAALVDALLGSDDYAAHMRDIFDFVLMERRGPEVTSQRRKNHWFDFLETAFRENRPWNEMVRELIVARPEAPDNRGAVWFLYERKNNHQLMAEAVAPVAFGMQVKCAQCHDHPLVPEIGQRHYWGLVAAFNRTKNVDVAGGPALAESAIGGFVNFTNLKKESQPALLEFLNGITVSETRPADGEKEEDSPEKYLIPPPPEKEKPTQASVPKFSRRNALADSVTRENPLLARAFVNRAWAMLIGRGLVHPVDEIDSKHPPTHPGLLDWLSRDFEENGYDIKRLFRILVLSRVYQLDSRPTQTVPIPPETFVRALEKPLSAEVLYRSWVTATGHQPDSDGRIAGHSEEELREAFIAQFPDLFPLEYNATLQQALFLANNPLLDTLLEPRANNTTAQLIALPDSQARVRRAFLAVLGRRPDSDELSHSAKFLEGREIKAGAKQLLWALLSSAEFQLNH